MSLNNFNFNNDPYPISVDGKKAKLGAQGESNHVGKTGKCRKYTRKSIDQMKNERVLMTEKLRKSDDTTELHRIIEAFNKAYAKKAVKAAGKPRIQEDGENAVRYAKSMYYTKRDENGALVYKQTPTEFERVCEYVAAVGRKRVKGREKAGVFGPLADLWKMDSSGQFVKNDAWFAKDSGVVNMRNYIARQEPKNKWADKRNNLA
jgi:hypothetical protein